MKRLVIAILAFLYMGSSVGATIQLHYCMGKLADWTLAIVKPVSCPQCGMNKQLVAAKNCCNDELQIIKTATDQKAAETSFITIYLAAAIPSDFVEAPADHLISLTEANPLSNGPPQSSSVAIYLRNRVFLI
ncbi:MAG: hypothetical protein V4717_09025 [Bacteroidota bacterium]